MPPRSLFAQPFPAFLREISLSGIAVAFLILACPARVGQAQESRDVLVLYSNSRLLPANVEVERGLRKALATSPETPVELFDEFLDTPRFRGDEYVQTMELYLREKYAKRPPDLIVATGDEALKFILRARADGLFPGVPVIHAGVFSWTVRSMAPLPADVVGVPIDLDFSATIDQALRWHPRARHMVVVTGASPLDREWEQQLRAAAAQFADRATFEFLAGLPDEEVAKRLRALPGDSIVFTTGYFLDGAGRSFLPRTTVERVVSVSGVPVYGSFDTFIGSGIVGGVMPSFLQIGEQAGESVLALVAGRAPSSLRFPAVTPMELHVDWRQIRRWEIDERAIPAGAVVHFREPTFMEQYRNEAIVALAVLLIQFTLIAVLLAERRRRRIAERNEQGLRFELAHASRLAIAGELTASIAHEINQPLGAILSNADAADMILESGGNRRDELRAILSDIRRDDLRASEVIRRLRALFSRHEVERQPFDVNEAVREVEAVLRVEARRRRVALDVRPAASDVTMAGDRIQIQQVLLNLILNAMDSVAELPEERRTIAVSVESLAGGVHLTVRDRGRGITAEQLPKLFDSFFSTKRTGMGLGLSIARTIVEAHGGHIRAESVPGDGAAFHVELPTAGEAVNMIAAQS